MKRGGEVPHILDLSTKLKCVDSFTLRPSEQEAVWYREYV